MYTIIDMHWIKDEQGNLFTKKAKSNYDAFIEWCHAGNTPLLEKPTEFYLVNGVHKGRNYKRAKMTNDTITKRQLQHKANVMSAQGEVIEQLCKSVLKYVTGRNNTLTANTEDVDAMETAFAPILDALSKNRFETAKAYIDQITPDGVMITDFDIEIINNLYAKHVPRINELKALVA